MSAARTALALLDTNIPDGFRATASLMREHHGPEHERHEMWAALANVFDQGADEIGTRVARWGPDAIKAMNGTGRAMVDVARAYLEAVAP